MVNGVISTVLAWTKQQTNIHGVALAGSQARGTATSNSDIDILILTSEPDLFRKEDWLEQIGLSYTGWRDAAYGVVWSRHILRLDGPELELSFAPLSWANTEPIDAGTRGVVSDGFCILDDPDGLFAELIEAITGS